MSEPCAVAADALTKHYGRRRAVEQLTFTVHAGQVCALLGPNGAGKTSTMRMLVGLSAPDAGTARIAGTPVRLGAPILQRVGVLIDGPALVPHLSGMANLRLLCAAARRHWPPPGLSDALDLAGLGPAVDRRVKGYSMGMKQRLMLAAALMRQPDVLILDEPSNGLDPAEVRALRQHLAARAGVGATALVSSHQLAEVQLMATHIVVMNQGRLVAAGPMDDLLDASAGRYRIHADHPDRAVEVLREMAGIVSATRQGTEVVVAAPTVTSSDLVQALVAAGVAVSGAGPAHRTLEDVYLDMTGGAEHAAR